VHTEICDRLGIEFPIFAFTHCRDVVAAVSNAGGIGVLGAIGFSPEELEIELEWLDEHVGDNPYGVDIVIPGKYEGMGEMDPVKLEAQLQSMVPDDHRRFARRLLAEHGVPEPAEDQKRSGMMGWTEATGKPLLAAALRHDKVKLIANALGTPPADVIARVKESGRLIGALAGSVKHALGHKEAGLDFIVCQGTEGGGHTGEIGSLVLWPEVIDAGDDGICRTAMTTRTITPTTTAPPIAGSLDVRETQIRRSLSQISGSITGLGLGSVGKLSDPLRSAAMLGPRPSRPCAGGTAASQTVLYPNNPLGI